MLYSTLKMLHITAGLIALACAAFAVFSAKGQRLHRQSGKVYVLAMLLIVLTAVLMSVLKPNVMLFFVAWFTAFIILCGYRLARHRSGIPSTIDWLLGALGVLTGLSMLGFTFLSHHPLAVATGVFGLICLGLALYFLTRMRRQQYVGTQRIAAHLTFMLSGTIATLTAVTVVNIKTNPPWIAWLLPTAVIVPLIIYWIIRVNKGAAKGVATLPS